jgi:hypothetical protein
LSQPKQPTGAPRRSNTVQPGGNHYPVTKFGGTGRLYVHHTRVYSAGANGEAVETRRYKDQNTRRWTTEQLIKRTVREDGSVDEEWRGEYDAPGTWVFFVLLPLAIFFWPLILVALACAVDRGGASYTRYVLKGPPDTKPATNG